MCKIAPNVDLIRKISARTPKTGPRPRLRFQIVRYNVTQHFTNQLGFCMLSEYALAHKRASFQLCL